MSSSQCVFATIICSCVCSHGTPRVGHFLWLAAYEHHTNQMELMSDTGNGHNCWCHARLYLSCTGRTIAIVIMRLVPTSTLLMANVKVSWLCGALLLLLLLLCMSGLIITNLEWWTNCAWISQATAIVLIGVSRVWHRFTWTIIGVFVRLHVWDWGLRPSSLSRPLLDSHDNHLGLNCQLLVMVAN